MLWIYYVEHWQLLLHSQKSANIHFSSYTLLLYFFYSSHIFCPFCSKKIASLDSARAGQSQCALEETMRSFLIQHLQGILSYQRHLWYGCMVFKEALCYSSACFCVCYLFWTYMTAWWDRWGLHCPFENAWTKISRESPLVLVNLKKSNTCTAAVDSSKRSYFSALVHFGLCHMMLLCHFVILDSPQEGEKPL